MRISDEARSSRPYLLPARRAVTVARAAFCLHARLCIDSGGYDAREVEWRTDGGDDGGGGAVMEAFSVGAC